MAPPKACVVDDCVPRVVAFFKFVCFVMVSVPVSAIMSVTFPSPQNCSSVSVSVPFLVSVSFYLDGPMLSPTPRGLGNLLDSPTVGVTAGEALAAAGSGCKFAIAAMP